MKYKTFTHTYETRGEKEIDLYKYRIKNIRLTWCKQILDIIHHFNIKKINDLGCNYFQLYKEINFQKKKYNYFGYDLEPKFIDIGLNKFKKFKKYKICNIESAKLRKADCSISSAVFEHLDNPKKFLNNIIKSTKKLIIIRGQFGIQEHIKKTTWKTLKPLNFNQYSFKKIEKKFSNFGFDCFYILDKATKYSTMEKFLNSNKVHKRNTFILLGIKR